jgi:hypothetical protein
VWDIPLSLSLPSQSLRYLCLLTISSCGVIGDKHGAIPGGELATTVSDVFVALCCWSSDCACCVDTLNWLLLTPPPVDKLLILMLRQVDDDDWCIAALSGLSIKVLNIMLTLVFAVAAADVFVQSTNELLS